MATLLEIANVLQSDVARKRVSAAMLKVAFDVLNEVPDGDATDDQLADLAKRKNAARGAFRNPHMAVEIAMTRVMSNATLQAKSSQMTSAGLPADIEATLDQDIIYVVATTFDSVVDLFPPTL